MSFLLVLMIIMPGAQGADNQDLFKRVHLYVLKKGPVDVREEAALARLLSTLWVQSKEERDTQGGEAQGAYARNQSSDVLFLAKKMRRRLAQDYPHLAKVSQQMGSVGAGLLCSLMSGQQGKAVRSSSASAVQDRDVDKAFELMIREAWLFSRSARDFLLLMVQERYPGLSPRQKRMVQKRVHAFYKDVVALGRTAEAYGLLLVTCRQSGSEGSRHEAFDYLESKGAYRAILHELCRQGLFQDMPGYWQKYVRNKREKRARMRSL
ncbi:hypothetical protein EIL50_01340 [bacterium NHP-B]|nr:hypothetical protein EIL50_01340 [bacterium NHP-B]